MKKIPRSALLSILFFLLTMTLALNPHRAASFLDEPASLIQEPVHFGSTNLAPVDDTHLTSTVAPPSAPINVKASEGEFTDKIRVTWGSIPLIHQVFIPLIISNGGSPAPTPDVTYYQVYRNTIPSTEDASELIGNYPASPYDDTSADPGVTYYYWVKACKSGGCSDFSAPAAGWQAEMIPAPPTGLSASEGTFSDKVHLSWTATENALHYTVFRNHTNTHDDEQVIAEEHTTCTYDDTNLTPGVTYHYWVKACNSAGCSDYTSSASGWRAEMVPSTPIEVSASQGTFTDRVSISWAASETANHYQVFRNTVQATEGAERLTDNHLTSPFEDTNATPATTYFFWIKACNSAGCSDYSSPTSGWRAEILPLAPGGVTASDGAFADKVSISWSASEHAKYYQVYRNVTETTQGAETLTSNYPSSPFEDTTAEPDVVYYYWVKACNTAGCSDFSTPDTGWRAAVLTIPSPPTDLSASDGGYTGKVHLTWTSSEGASFYQVYRNTTENSGNAEQLSGEHPAIPYDDTTADPGVTYYYWVKACNSVGCSDYSSPDSGWWAEILPSPPTGLSASDGNYTDKVRLTWIASDGANFYQVFRNTVNSHTGIMELTGDHTTCLYDDMNAEPGVTYYYWVNACNSAGCSAYSSPNSGWRAEIIPLPPTGLSASAGDHTDKVHLAWTASERAKYYQVYRNTSENHSGASVLTENHPSSSYEDLTAVPGVTFFYWIKACNSAGCSDFSSPAWGWRAETIPQAPTSLSASDGVYTDKIHLSWICSEGAKYYQIFRNTINDHAGQDVLEYSHPTCTYDDMSAVPGIIYYYWVKACNSAGCSVYSSPASGRRAEIVPAPPTGVTASDGGYTDKVLLSWQAPEGASYFKIYQNTINDHDSASELVADHPASPFEDTSAIPETIYYYWVKACNSAGCSAYSSPDTGWRALVNIANGDFEAGNDGSWSVYSKKGRNLIIHADFTSITPHSGHYLAWLGGDNDETSRLTQSLDIPSSHPYLHFWYLIQSDDTCDYDYARVRINGSTFKIFELCSPNNTNGWTSEVLNLSFFAGNTITLQFEVTTDPTYISNFYLDDITLSSMSTTSASPNQGGVLVKLVLE